MSKLAFGTFGTEPGQIIFTRLIPDMTIPAIWAMFAKTPLVPRTILDVIFRADVQEETFNVTAGPERREEMARRHLAQVVLVQELALIVLLA